MPPEKPIRAARGHEDLEACVALQREVWGLADLEVTSAVQLAATVHAGGLLLVAEGADGALDGFCYAFAALRGGEPHLHSDMLAVRPGARARGLGLRLKWAQRRHALALGLRLVTWTFDPLRARNARLNLRHLGATCAEFLPDFYGTTSSALHHGLPTDRLLARWDLESARVARRAALPSSAGEVAGQAVEPEETALLLEALPGPGDALPRPARRTSSADALRLEIPGDWDVLCAADAGLAREWQLAVREAFQEAFQRGLVACDFAPHGERAGGYVLRRPPLPG